MKRIVLIFALFVSCSPRVSKTELQNPKPAWLSAKPLVDAYYIGIGHGVKDGTSNYLQSAKKSALEDLVSEIKVNVSSTSVLSQLDTDKEFSQRYEQIIQTTAVEEIEEFEQVEAWEDDRNYWVYYRLSKQRYREIKEQQKRDAVTLALDFFTKAKKSEKAGEIIQALSFYLQGFRAIEKYLAEPIRLDFEGREILLTNEIYSSMQQLLDRIQLTATPASLAINRRVAQSNQTVMVKANFKTNGKQFIVDLPLKATFEKGAGDVFPDYKTDATGQAKILLSKISARDLEQTVSVKVNLLALAGQNPSEIYSLVAKKLVVPNVAILLAVQRPLVYLTSDERSLGAGKTNQQIANKIRNYLTSEGFEFTDDLARAELKMDVISDSEKGAVSGSIYITYVTATIKVAATKDNKEIYATTLDRIKGYSLDYERSSQEAYNKSLEALEKEKLPQLLNAILH